MFLNEAGSGEDVDNLLGLRITTGNENYTGASGLGRFMKHPNLIFSTKNTLSYLLFPPSTQSNPPHPDIPDLKTTDPNNFLHSILANLRVFIHLTSSAWMPFPETHLHLIQEITRSRNYPDKNNRPGPSDRINDTRWLLLPLLPPFLRFFNAPSAGCASVLRTPVKS